jgi:quercetin dioxygenase-like cupin family protein
MDIRDVDFVVTDWRNVAPVEHPGRSGVALWRTFEAGNVRVRLVEYSAGYEADHWCERGHVIYVLRGELETRLADGRVFRLTEGMSYQVAGGAEPHLSKSQFGVTLFIVD